MRQIVTTAPDVEAHLIGLGNAPSSPLPAKLFNVAPGTSGAYSHYLIRADLQNRATAISRYCRVGVQAWSVDAQGRVNLADAFDLATAFGTWIESLSGQGIILHAEVDSGPMRVADDIQKKDFSYLTVLLEVTVN